MSATRNQTSHTFIISKKDDGGCDEKRTELVRDDKGVIHLNPLYVCSSCYKKSQYQMGSCSKCHIVYYCSSECQRKDYTQHKVICRIETFLPKKSETLLQMTNPNMIRSRIARSLIDDLTKDNGRGNHLHLLYSLDDNGHIEYYDDREFYLTLRAIYSGEVINGIQLSRRELQCKVANWNLRCHVYCVEYDDNAAKFKHAPNCTCDTHKKAVTESASTQEDSRVRRTMSHATFEPLAFSLGIAFTGLVFLHFEPVYDITQSVHYQRALEAELNKQKKKEKNEEDRRKKRNAKTSKKKKRNNKKKTR